MLPLNQPSKTNKPIQKDRQKCNCYKIPFVTNGMHEKRDLDTKGWLFLKTKFNPCSSKLRSQQS